MNFGNINNQRLAVLEQACERYAIMAFETLNSRLAIGLKSIKYSYCDDERFINKGIFVAEFVPWDISDCPTWENRRMTIEWDIAPQLNCRWKIYNGTVSVQGESGLHTIGWSESGTFMVFQQGKMYIASAGTKIRQTYQGFVIV